ncbi:MAG: periplasmic heavy metal sensor [Proteobacteria bacterium]|nr:periplasmic heavy metal sensor [Pseudomonadota bacterium]
MNSRLVQFLLALSLLLNCFVLAGFVYRTWIAPPFEHAGPPPGGRPGGPLEMMANDLKLDDNQRKALRDLFDKNQAERRERIHGIQQAREQMSDELKKQPVDFSKIDALVDEVSKQRAEQQKANLHAILALDEHLTPQQRERMHEILADRYLGFGPGGRGRPGGPRRPPPQQ